MPTEPKHQALERRNSRGAKGPVVCSSKCKLPIGTRRDRSSPLKKRVGTWRTVSEHLSGGAGSKKNRRERSPCKEGEGWKPSRCDKPLSGPGADTEEIIEPI